MTGDFLIVKKYLSNPLVTGTIFLTLAGTTSRFMGFFFRIFLNNVMGSTGLGLYQLVIPLMSVCMSLCCNGFQTATSKRNNYVSHHCSFAHNYYVFQCQLHKPLYFKWATLYRACQGAVLFHSARCYAFLHKRILLWIEKSRRSSCHTINWADRTHWHLLSDIRNTVWRWQLL